MICFWFRSFTLRDVLSGFSCCWFFCLFVHREPTTLKNVFVIRKIQTFKNEKMDNINEKKYLFLFVSLKFFNHSTFYWVQFNCCTLFSNFQLIIADLIMNILEYFVGSELDQFFVLLKLLTGNLSPHAFHSLYMIRIAAKGF